MMKRLIAMPRTTPAIRPSKTAINGFIGRALPSGFTVRAVTQAVAEAMSARNRWRVLSPLKNRKAGRHSPGKYDDSIGSTLRIQALHHSR